MKKLNLTQLLKCFDKDVIETNSLEISIRNLVMSCFTIYAFKKLFFLLKKYYFKWYAANMVKYYETQLKNEELIRVKKYLLYEKIEKIRAFNEPIRILEIGFCGSNFNYFPNYSILTMCNCLADLEDNIKLSFKSYEKNLWLSPRNLAVKLTQIKSESIDVLVCTHYLCCSTTNFNQLINEIYRVLKPVKFIS